MNRVFGDFQQVFRSALTAGFAAIAAITFAGITASRIEAAVVWHESLASAKAASVASQRPVLVVFTAAWSEASERFVQTTLAAPEATAIVSSCFEPVRLDVDANGELARRLGVSHLPSGCILDQNEAVLARFDCPESSIDFVSNAARAIQTAAQARVTAGGSTTTPAPSSAPSSPATSGSAPPAVPPAATSRFAAAEPTIAPPLPATPPAWPATPTSEPLVASAAPGERMSAFASAAAQPAAVPARQTIEPATTGEPWAAARPPVPPPAIPAGPTMPSATTAAAPTASPYPSTAYPSTYPSTATTQSYPTTQAPPASPYSGYPSTSAVPPASGGLPIYSGTTPSTTAATPASPATPAPATPEKEKSTNAFVAFFQDPTSLFKKSSTKEAAPEEIAKPSASTKPQPATPRNPSIASQSTAVPSPPANDPYGSMPVGLEGYCPVTLVEKSIWVEGRPQWGARHRGRTYLFAGPAEQQAFLAAADRYAPALSGDDPVLAFDSGKQVPGQRRYGVTYQSRIYLFSSPEARTAFTVAPDKYVTRVLVAENPQAAPGTFVR